MYDPDALEEEEDEEVRAMTAAKAGRQAVRRSGRGSRVQAAASPAMHSGVSEQGEEGDEDFDAGWCLHVHGARHKFKVVAHCSGLTGL